MLSTNHTHFAQTPNERKYRTIKKYYECTECSVKETNTLTTHSTLKNTNTHEKLTKKKKLKKPKTKLKKLDKQKTKK